MKTFKMFLALLAVALLAAVPAGAAGFATQVGGLSLVMTTNGTATSGPAAVTWTTAVNYSPDVIQCINDTDSQPNMFTWYKGMSASYTMLTTGSTGVVTYTSINAATENCNYTVSTTAGTITIAAGCLVASQPYFCWAARYQQ